MRKLSIAIICALLTLITLTLKDCSRLWGADGILYLDGKKYQVTEILDALPDASIEQPESPPETIDSQPDPTPAPEDGTLGSVLSGSQGARKWPDSDIVQYHGKAECRYLRTDFQEVVTIVLEHVAATLEVDRFYVGSSCPRTGSCQGHGGNHAAGRYGFREFDLDYVTASGNATQYGPAPQTDDPMADINWEANWLIVDLLRAYCPHLRVVMYLPIYQRVLYFAKRKYGAAAVSRFVAAVSPDPGTDAYHHRHMHFTLGIVSEDEINLKATLP